MLATRQWSLAAKQLSAELIKSCVKRQKSERLFTGGKFFQVIEMVKQLEKVKNEGQNLNLFCDKKEVCPYETTHGS